MISRDIARGLKHLERALGNPTFSWNGNNYPFVPGHDSQSRRTGPGGLAIQDDHTLVVRLAVFGDGPRPQLKHIFIVDGMTRRLDEIQTSPDGSYLTYLCNSPDRGA